MWHDLRELTDITFISFLHTINLIDSLWHEFHGILWGHPEIFQPSNVIRPDSFSFMRENINQNWTFFMNTTKHWSTEVHEFNTLHGYNRMLKHCDILSLNIEVSFYCYIRYYFCCITHPSMNIRKYSIDSHIEAVWKPVLLIKLERTKKWLEFPMVAYVNHNINKEKTH